MYSYIIGKVKEINSNNIILECHNIGYLIYVPNPFSYKVDEEYKVYVYNKIAEDEYSLYGFKTRDEYELFLRLISVKGVGAKLALPILATGSIAGIVDAIDRENILYLTKFPKIGDKLARQIILDLKGKLNFEVSEELISDETEDLIDTLTALGYKTSEIKKVIGQIDKSLSLEEQVKEALKLLLKQVVMTKKGFTLVELLVVIVIIVIISAIGFGGITLLQKNVKEGLWEGKVDLILSGAKLYGEDYKYRLSETCVINEIEKNSCLTITVQDLIDNGYVSTDEVDDAGNKVIINEALDESDHNYYANHLEVYIYLENNIVYAQLENN